MPGPSSQQRKTGSSMFEATQPFELSCILTASILALSELSALIASSGEHFPSTRMEGTPWFQSVSALLQRLIAAAAVAERSSCPFRPGLPATIFFKASQQLQLMSCSPSQENNSRYP
jgi:hypothetical protein